MEKYTIDIDKVLDEFEETEALKVHADKHLNESVIEHRLSTNGSTFEGKIGDNSWSENVINTNLSQVDRSHSILGHVSDSNLPLQSETLKSAGQHLTTNLYCTLDSEKNISNVNIAPGSFTKTEIQCTDGVNATHLSYDIFYKPRESDLHFVGKNSEYSQSITCPSNSLSQQYTLNDSSPDEILCVSVQEKNIDLNPHESQNKDVSDFTTKSAAYSSDFITEKSVSRTDSSNESDSYPIAQENVLHCKGEETKFNYAGKSGKLCDSYQSKGLVNCEPEYSAFSQKIDTEQGESDDVINRDQTANSIGDCGHNTSPCSKIDDLLVDDKSSLDAQTGEKQATGSTSVALNDLHAIQTLSHSDDLAELDDTVAHNFQETEQVNPNVLNLENNFDLHGDVLINNLNLENGFGIHDDDSGVSSTEDISGNSPPEIVNGESVDSVVSEKCDLENNFLTIASCDSIVCDTDACKEFQICENQVISASSQQTNNDENQQETSCTNENSFSVTNTNINIHSCNAYAGARSKIDNSNGDFPEHRSEENLVEALSEELKTSESSDVPSDSISSKEIISNVETLAQNNEIIAESHISVQDFLKETVHDSSVLNSNDKNCDESILEKNSRERDGFECSDESLSIDSKDGNFSPRLQRPTTLDLPSLIIASTETSDLSHSRCNEALPGADVLAEVSISDPNISELIPSVKQPQIGIVKPYWIPDAEALNCMHCGMKFTVIKRRHHCRGCGKVLCSRCCNQKAYLSYLNKEDRICQPCADILLSASHIDPQVPVPFDSQSSSSCGSSPNFSPSPQIPTPNFGDKSIWRPHPNNPDDYCSTIPPLQQIQSSTPRPPPTVMVPIGVLKRGNKPRREPKQVIFSDGIRPGGDLTDLTEPVEVVPVYRRIGRKRVDKIISGESKLGSLSMPIHKKNRQKKVIVSDGEGHLPPVVLETGGENDETPDWNQILEKIQDDQQKAVSFALMKNLHLYVKLIKLDCCFGSECWCFTSHGLCTVGQDEVMVILQRLPGEKNIPRDILKLFTQVYDSASKGSTFEDLGHIIFPEQILDSSDHRGFLFVRPTFQCLSKLTVPNTPYLVAILIHKWEVPWAKVFPLRLMLRMGAECRYYPCALVSVRHRKPVYFEIGQTIMSVLSDLRNYQFTIPVIPGLVVHMEEKKTCVNIPRNRYEKVMKVLNSNNVEHVLALGSNFSTEADSHLVCMQKEEGDYQTQAINIENTTRRVTGASFIVFSGALKSTSGLSAKFSIVEDGLLIQIPQETMVNLHMALRDMRDLTIECGQINAAEPEEVVIVQWTRDDKKFNIGVQSPIDGKSFEGVPNLRIHTSTDYAGENYLIRWTEVFFLDVDDCGSAVQNELVDPCRLAETVAQSCCMALTPYLDQLAEAELLKLGLRVTLDSQRDRVEYDIGSRGKALPVFYMNALDSGLIPVILRLSGSTPSEKLSFELIFHILIK